MSLFARSSNASGLVFSLSLPKVEFKKKKKNNKRCLQSCWGFEKKKKCQKKRTFIFSFMILFHFLHSWNQVPFLWFLGYSQWSQVPFQHLQCLLISWLCDKRASLVLKLSVGLGYFYGLWTLDQHSPPSDQHFPSDSPPETVFFFSITSTVFRACFFTLLFETQSSCLPRINLSFVGEFQKNLQCFVFFGNKNWGILFIDKNPLWKTFFFWLNAMMFTKFTNLKYRSPFKWQEKLQCEWRNSVFLIITGCGKSQFEFFLQETCCFCFLNPKKAQEQTQIYDMWVSWRQFQKQQNWVKNWEFHFSDLCWMFFGCCWNQVIRHSLKPQNWSPKNHRKFGFIVLKEQWQVTCQSIHNTNPEFLCLHFTTLNNKIKVKKIQERTKMWLGEFPPKLRSSVNHFSEKEKTQHEILWGCHPTWARTWALSNGVERDTWVAKQWRLWSSLGFN